MRQNSFIGNYTIMDIKQFVACWAEQKETLLDDYYLTNRLKEVGLPPEQLEQFKHAVDAILTDSMYSLLLGLDGAAAIGSIQQPYVISTANGQVLSHGDGELEAQAWREFRT
jgi:hypothetical protein